MDLYKFNAVVMFLLKGLITHCLLAIINLVSIGDLCIFGIQHGVGRTFIFSGIVIKFLFYLIHCGIN